MQPAWVTAIKQQCDKHGSLFFFKQWGGVQKAKNGRQFNGRTYDEMPARTTPRIRSRADREQLAHELAALTKPWNATPLVQLRTASAELR